MDDKIIIQIEPLNEAFPEPKEPYVAVTEQQNEMCFVKSAVKFCELDVDTKVEFKPSQLSEALTEMPVSYTNIKNETSADSSEVATSAEIEGNEVDIKIDIKQEPLYHVKELEESRQDADPDVALIATTPKGKKHKTINQKSEIPILQAASDVIKNLNVNKDEHDEFGAFVASQLRALTNKHLRKELRKKIMLAILEVQDKYSN